MKITTALGDVQRLNEELLADLRNGALVSRQRLHDVIVANVQASRAAFAAAHPKARVAAVLLDMLDGAPGEVDDLRTLMHAAGLASSTALQSHLHSLAHDRAILADGGIRVIDVSALRRAAAPCSIPG